MKWCSEYRGQKFHAVLTDCPYELSFMGKHWDGTGISFQKETWAAIAKLLYPGAYLLAFGGTRTFHRIAVAIEDAGFEIRDTILYVFGQGFPKSHNFGCKCQRGTVPYTHDSKPKTEHDLPTLPDSDVPEAVAVEAGSEILLNGLPEQGSSKQGSAWPEPKPARSEQPSVEGRGDVLAKARELQADKVRPLSEGVSANGTEGRLHHGTQADSGPDNRTATNEDGGSPPYQPRPARQQGGEPDAIPDEQATQNLRGQECQKCGGVVGWQGYGSALKPAYEPIIVARLPLDGTMKNNVQKYGSGALNIDGSRVGTEGGGTHCDNRDEQGRCRGHKNAGRSTSGETIHAPVIRENRTTETKGGDRLSPSLCGYEVEINDGEYLVCTMENNHADEHGQIATGVQSVPSLGRWPANLIHDGSQEVLDLFPNTKAGVAVRSKSGGNTFGGDNPKPPMDDIGYDDSGSAARFFYSAKVSKSERNAGLGLASSGIVCYNVSICENNTTLVGKSAQLQVDTERLVVKVIDESGIQESDALLWNTVSCMKSLMEQSLKDLSSTTETKISWTTELKTLNWLAQLLTSVSIQVANSETTDGGSLVVNAKEFFTSPAFTERKDGWSDNASRVASGLQLKISASEIRSSHPTLKPLSLTKYLATLVLPPKLDQPRRLLVPFSGAGSEVIGALQAGWDEVVGVEQSKEYCEIAEARIKHWI